MSVEKDIRPVSLTCQVAKVMESFTLVRLLPVLLDKLDLKQFALSGRSTSQALVYLLHLALDALDKGNCALCFFFADFKKGFDLIDHRILLRKLSGYGLVSPDWVHLLPNKIFITNFYYVAQAPWFFYPCLAQKKIVTFLPNKLTVINC